jgi:hypothetical protein
MPEALSNLGTYYHLGKGTTRNLVKALELFEQAATKPGTWLDQFLPEFRAQHKCALHWLMGAEAHLSVNPFSQTNWPRSLYEELTFHTLSQWETNALKTIELSSPLTFARAHNLSSDKILAFMEDLLTNNVDLAPIVTKLWVYGMDQNAGGPLTLDLSPMTIKIPSCLLWISAHKPLRLKAHEEQYQACAHWRHLLGDSIKIERVS